MPTIQSGATSDLATVDPTVKAIRAALYPKNQESYSARATTGLLGATLAADAPIFGIRNASAAAKSLYIEKIDLGFSVTTAFTATQQFGLYLERFNAAVLGGGAAAAVLRHDASGTGASEIAGAGGGAVVATTAALTVVGVAFEGQKVPILGWSNKNLDAQIGPATVFDASEGAPIVLAAGEGLSIRNLIVWPAAGVGVVTGRVFWSER